MMTWSSSRPSRSGLMRPMRLVARIADEDDGDLEPVGLEEARRSAGACGRGAPSGPARSPLKASRKDRPADPTLILTRSPVLVTVSAARKFPSAEAPRGPVQPQFTFWVTVHPWFARYVPAYQDFRDFLDTCFLVTGFLPAGFFAAGFFLVLAFGTAAEGCPCFIIRLANFVKNCSASDFAVESIRRDPSMASLPPICASTS